MNRTLVPLFWLSLALAPLALAQTASTPVSVASFANPNFINGKIAQGMMFEIFGAGIAMPGFNQPADFPLPTELAGTSVRVTVGGQVRDCFVVRTLNNDRVAAILPSDTPVGTGTLVVTFNGQSTPSVPIEVVAHSPGVFTLASTGSGPGVFTDPLNNQVNTVFNAFQPGDLVDVWMTGLGAAPFPDNILPPLADLGYDVDITVGGIAAQDSFHGRSAGCCSAIDIARFTIPAGVQGCHVPVIISVNGVPGNVTTISIAANRGTCDSGDLGLDSELFTRAQENGSASLGTIALTRTTLTIDGFPAPVSQVFELNLDAAGGGFHRFTPDELLRYRDPFNVTTIGACGVLQFRGEQFDNADPIRDAAVGLDAGVMTLTGPAGSRTIERLEVGVYFQSLSTGIPGFPSTALIAPSLLSGLPSVSAALSDSKNQTSRFLVPGDYVVAMSGGADVGALAASITVSEKAVTNLDSIDVVPRDRALRITYSGTSSADWVWISGISIITAETDPQGAVFMCRAPVDTGSFDVPSEILKLLPPSEVISLLKEEGAGRKQSIPTGFLMVGLGSINSFSASGLDQGSITQIDVDMRAVQYE